MVSVTNTPMTTVSVTTTSAMRISVTTTSTGAKPGRRRTRSPGRPGDPGARTRARPATRTDQNAGILAGRRYAGSPVADRSRAAGRRRGDGGGVWSPSWPSAGRRWPAGRTPRRSTNSASTSTWSTGSAGPDRRRLRGQRARWRVRSRPPTSRRRSIVDVVGRVHRPGLVTLPPGARVADAVRAAGGALAGTNLSSINLARVCVDGEQIAVGVPGAVAAARTGPSGIRRVGAPGRWSTSTPRPPTNSTPCPAWDR